MEDNTHTAYQPTQPEPETTPEHAQGEPAMENTLPRATPPAPEYNNPMPAPAIPATPSRLRLPFPRKKLRLPRLRQRLKKPLLPRLHPE